MKKMKHSKLTQSKYHYVFLAPHFIIFCIFFVVPIVYGIYVSFTRWDMFTPPQWIGFYNYQTILFNSESTFHRQFWTGFRNTFQFVLMMVPIQIVVPLALALALFAKPIGGRIFQGIFYIPTLFSISAAVLTWYFILHPGFGLLNNVVFTEHINWFGTQPFAWISILAVTTWWVIGLNMIIYIAALHGIDDGILEYAKLDGASGLRRLLYVYLPLIRLPLLFTVIASTASQFNIFGQPLMLTGGGPAESTHVLIMYIRTLAFGIGRPIAGLASSMAVMLGLCIGILSVIQMRIIMKLDAHN